MNTALVTGAGRGIGLATARAFREAGWKVLALDKEFPQRDEKGFDFVQFDLRKLDQIKKLIESLGEIHTLVNNAGVLFCDPYDAISEEHKREVLTVNIEAPVTLIVPVKSSLAAPAPVVAALLLLLLVTENALSSNWAAGPNVTLGVAAMMLFALVEVPLDFLLPVVFSTMLIVKISPTLRARLSSNKWRSLMPA